LGVASDSLQLAYCPTASVLMTLRCLIDLIVVNCNRDVDMEENETVTVVTKCKVTKQDAVDEILK